MTKQKFLFPGISCLFYKILYSFRQSCDYYLALHNCNFKLLIKLKVFNLEYQKESFCPVLCYVRFNDITSIQWQKQIHQRKKIPKHIFGFGSLACITAPVLDVRQVIIINRPTESRRSGMFILRHFGEISHWD